MTDITSIVQGNFDPQPDLEIGIFGQLSMHIVDPISKDTKFKVKIDWSSGVLRPDVIFSDIDKQFKIMSRGTVSDVGLMDNIGKPLWSYKPSGVIINTMAAGDLDRNGELEFYVATHGGLHQLNHLGKELWVIGGFVHDVEVLYPGKDKIPLVVTINFDNQIQFRNYSGKLVRELNPRIQINDIELVEWPAPEHILTRSDSSFYIMDWDGNIAFKHNLNRHIYAIRGTSVHFKDNQDPYFAVVAKFSSTTGQAMLCIFSPDRKLFYKELINSTTGLLAISTPRSKREVLLVGDGPGRVYKYILNEKEPSGSQGLQ